MVKIPLLHVGPSNSVPVQLHWKDSSVMAGDSTAMQIPPFWQGLDSQGLLASKKKQYNHPFDFLVCAHRFAMNVQNGIVRMGLYGHILRPTFLLLLRGIRM